MMNVIKVNTVHTDTDLKLSINFLFKIVIDMHLILSISVLIYLVKSEAF